MSWVRIHDGALTHPKIIGLSDKAFRLWVWGLSYCQQHLTDGKIPKEAITFKTGSAIGDLILKGLWVQSNAGFNVHDYLDYNDSRVRVNEQRTASKERMQRFRERTARDVPVGSGNGTDPEALVERGTGGKPAAGHRKHAYCGLKFCVPDFLHEQFSNQLGERGLARFDLLEWYPKLDDRYEDFPVGGDILAWIRSEFTAATKELFVDPKLARAMRAGVR